MKRKEQYADEIIEMLERTKSGAWASNINLNTKDRVIEVCQNCVDSWSGRKFKDHCTTSPQALEQTRWIPVSERLPVSDEDVLVTNGKGIYIGWIDLTDKKWRVDCSSEYFMEDIIAWMPLPQPYKAESEDEG